MIKRLLINDFILIIFILFLSVVLGLFLYSNNSTSSDIVTVIIGGEIYKDFSLDKDAETELSDTEVVLTIDNGNAYISHSDCPDKLCMNMPEINKQSPDSSSIVCLPNKVAITKKNESKVSKQGVDVIAS